MKKIFTMITIMLFTVASWAQNADYLLKKDFQSEKKKISEGIDAAKKAGYDAKKIATKQVTVFDSMARAILANEKVLKQNNDSLQKTTATFSSLQNRVSKMSTKTKFFLRLIVIGATLLFILLIMIVYALKKKYDKEIYVLTDENKRLGESLDKEVVAIREELRKTSDSLSLTMHEFSANTTVQIEQLAEKQNAFKSDIEESLDKFVKEQITHKSILEEKIIDFLAKANYEKTEHKALHEKLELEVNGLKSKI